MDDKTPPPPYAGDKRRVVVIGAGIAGLTAAHELAERGFEVEVVESEASPYDGTPLVGGMARTTWATVPVPAAQFPLHAGPPGELRGLELDHFVPLDVPYDSLYSDDADPRSFQGGLLDVFKRWGRVAATVSGAFDAASRTEFEKALENAIPKAWDATYLTDRDLPLANVQRATRRTGAPVSPTMVQFTTWSVRVPGEHGFRFFPSFYRNMFDTMKRIPIEEASITASATAGVTLTSDSSRTAFDALLSADEIGLGLEHHRGRDRSYAISRHPIRSLQQLRELVHNALERAGYRGEDLYRLATRYLEYATSSTVRRQHEYEQTTWSTFLGLDRGFTPYFASHVRGGSQALAAMSSESNDTRTIGSIAFQLTLDELRVNESGYDDATLRGPTSISLFGPWQSYLASQNVRFTCARLVGFAGSGMAVRPVFTTANGDARSFVQPADYYVVAIPIQALKALFDASGQSTSEPETLMPLADVLKANKQCLELDELEAEEAGRPLKLPPQERDDLSRHFNYPMNDYATHPDAGPLRYMCGIQFYFDADVRLFLGHTLCLDSAWGVSYISQEQYWQDRDRGQQGVRGVLSAILTRFEAKAPSNSDPTCKTALECTEDELAARVWKQIADTWDTSLGDPPVPRYYFLDHNLSRDPGTKTWTNATPYLVNQVGDWEKRGGGRHPDGTYEYPVQLGHTVFAGTFMRTTTRLNSMEAANESGRRAVNAILDRAAVRGQQVPIWDLEEFEVPELRPLRELDARLFRRGGRHVLRSTVAESALRAMPWDLVRLGLPTRGEER